MHHHTTLSIHVQNASKLSSHFNFRFSGLVASLVIRTRSSGDRCAKILGLVFREVFELGPTQTYIDCGQWVTNLGILGYTVNSRFSDTQFSEKPRFSEQFVYYRFFLYECKNSLNLVKNSI